MHHLSGCHRLRDGVGAQALLVSPGLCSFHHNQFLKPLPFPEAFSPRRPPAAPGTIPARGACSRQAHGVQSACGAPAWSCKPRGVLSPDPAPVSPKVLAVVMLHHRKGNTYWLWISDSNHLLFLAVPTVKWVVKCSASVKICTCISGYTRERGLFFFSVWKPGCQHNHLCKTTCLRAICIE